MKLHKILTEKIIIFIFTYWAEDGFSVISKCTVYTSTEGSGIKYVMFYDNWGEYLPNGKQSGWQRDNSVRYVAFIATTQKKIITILESLLSIYIIYHVYNTKSIFNYR